MRSDRALALVSEIADVLASHGRVRCVPTIAEEDSLWSLMVTFHADDVAGSLELLSLADELRYVADVAQMRAFAELYGIEPAALERLLPAMPRRQEEDPSTYEFTDEELDALILLIESGCIALANAPISVGRMLIGALPKLKALRGQAAAGRS